MVQKLIANFSVGLAGVLLVAGLASNVQADGKCCAATTTWHHTWQVNEPCNGATCSSTVDCGIRQICEATGSEGVFWQNRTVACERTGEFCEQLSFECWELVGYTTDSSELEPLGPICPSS
jgi:hypothetical protein